MRGSVGEPGGRSVVSTGMHWSADEERVAHLLRRFGLGASEAEVAHYGEGGYERAVDRLLEYESVDEHFPLKLEDLRGGKQNAVRMPAVVLWWIARMAMTRRPLQEKMTLFWHDHFATSASKVNLPLLMAQQNETLRRNATGGFRTMLREVSQDPAMLFWLDNQENVKGKPNENFAREVMELFTLGIGHYSETDVQEAARAFTGWSFVRRRNPEAGGAVGEFLLRPRLHDAGEKRVLGRTGDLGGEDVLDVLCDHPQTAEHLTRKLWEWFVYPNPDSATVDRFAKVFRDKDLQIRPLLRAIMLSPEFLSERARRKVFKTPVDFVVPTLRQLGIGESMADLLSTDEKVQRRQLGIAAAANTAMKGMGMWLFYPPDVAGWDGGAAWVTTATMVERMKWADRLFRAYPTARLVGANPSAEELVDRLLDVLDAPLSGARRAILVEAARKPGKLSERTIAVARLIFASPEFQMG